MTGFQGYVLTNMGRCAQDAYAAYEVDAHARICGVVDKEVPVNLQPLYQWYLEKIFKRSK